MKNAKKNITHSAVAVLRSNRFCYVVYASLTLLILSPLLKPGYILTVDMVFAPTIPVPETTDSSFPLYLLLHYINYAIPSWVIQKLLLFLVFFCAGLGAHKLMEYFTSRQNSKVAGQWPYYFFGALYMWNSLVYTRFMAGQYILLLGYALLPFLIRSAWMFFNNPTLKNAAKLTFITLLISIVSLHTLGLALILLGCVGAVCGWQHRHEKQWWQTIVKYSSLITLLLLAASSYWLLPLLSGHGRTADIISGFTATDQQAFNTVPGELGLVGNVLALQGFWGDAQNLYLLPEDVFAWWWVPLCALWLLVVSGMVWSWKHQRQVAVLFGSVGFIGLVLAIGGAGTIFAPLNNWLFEHVPFFAGYREPQKFAALIVLAYAYFGGVGVYWLGERLRNTKFSSLVWAALLVPILCTPLLLWGGAGQLKASDYPADWYTVNKLLVAEDIGNSKVLFLPWHLYMPYSFSSGVIANPAPRFFDVPIISSQNPELGGAHGYYIDQTGRAVNQLMLHDPARNDQLARQLAALDVRYIILAKEFDYKKYEYLNSKPGVTIHKDMSKLILYHIEEGVR